MDLEIRAVTPKEFDEWLRVDSRAYGSHLEDAKLERLKPAFDLGRSLAAFDRGRIVGGACSTLFEMAVPGGSLPIAGVLAVSVQPTHRRRGILTRMTDHQLRDIHERGEPIAALFAAESIIYGRFGYGMSTIHENWTIERQHTAYARPHERRGRISFISPQEMRAVFPDVFQRSTAGRPGAIQREEYVWDNIVADPDDERRGRSAYFHVVYERDGKIDGYVSYRTRGEKMLVQELMAATDEAHAALWRFCLDVDLMASTEAWTRPVDDPLPWMLADPRRLKRSPLDGMWLRLVDVPAALSGRRYMQSGRLVLEVRDGFCPWNDGRYELDGGLEGAACHASGATPDLVLSAADLAATYLGAVRFTTLSRAGRVEERTPGALRRADAMFATELAPWSPYAF